MECDTESLFFRKIDDPVECRRAGLESMRDSIAALRRFEDVKRIRIEKVRTAARLKDQLHELGVLMHRLHDLLPCIDQPRQPMPITKPTPAKTFPLPERPKEDGCTELERQLREIDQKLRELGS